MNLHLYKVLDMSDYGNCDDLEKTQVMTERNLREEFGYAVNNDIVPIQLMKDYQQGEYADEDWSDPENTLRIGVIIDMMNDICNYKSGTGYYILETDVDVELNPKMISEWLDTLNYWYEHIEDYGDRYPDMRPMVKKFDNTINELYRLSKGE